MSQFYATNEPQRPSAPLGPQASSLEGNINGLVSNLRDLEARLIGGLPPPAPSQSGPVSVPPSDVCSTLSRAEDGLSMADQILARILARL